MVLVCSQPCLSTASFPTPSLKALWAPVREGITAPPAVYTLRRPYLFRAAPHLEAVFHILLLSLVQLALLSKILISRA